MSTTTPAAVEATVVYLVSPGTIDLRSESIRLDTLAAREIACETLVTAISPGTELAAYAGAPALRDGVAYPRLQGYCNVARVLAAGPEVREVAPGDRILTFASHRSHFIMAAEDVLLKLPATGRSDDYALTYLFHLGYNAILRSDVRLGSRVLVIGLGVLGLATVAVARAAGAQVVAISEHAEPTRIARAFGAAGVFRRTERDAARAALTDRLADVVVTTSNEWADWALALDMTGMRGTVASLGFPGRGQPAATFNPLDSRTFYAKQLRIESVGMSPERPDARGFLRFNERDNLRFLADRIAAGELSPAPLVSGVYVGRDIEQAYRALASREGSPITYLLRWNQE